MTKLYVSQTDIMQRIIAKAIGGIKLSDVQMDEIIKCGAKGGCIMSGMMSL